MQLLANYSVVECNNFIAYGSADCRDPAPYGVFDPHLGATKEDNCKTCHQNRVACPGHFGHIQLALPIFHTGYFTHTYNLLQMICKSCSRVLLEDRTDENGNIIRERVISAHNVDLSKGYQYPHNSYGPIMVNLKY